MPPAMLETAYNLVRAKLVRLGLAQRVDVEIDSSRCSRSSSTQYDSWLMEMLNLGQPVERNHIWYKLTVHGKPYIHAFEYIGLEGYGKLLYTHYEHDSRNGVICVETTPDTALGSIRLRESLLDACQEDYLPMKVEEAIAIVRRTFLLDSTHPCIRAMPSKEKHQWSLSNDCEEGFWGIALELEPSDTTFYHKYKFFF